MYSKRIQSVLKRKKIKVGDRVRLSKGKRGYEGVLMPRIEMGDTNSLIVKLENGYNIGVKVSKGVKLKKIGRGKRLGVIPKAKIKRKKGLPNISFIGTGGTIGTHVDYLTGGVYMCRKPEEIIATAPELGDIVNIKSIRSPFTIASEDMTHREWQKIAKEVAKELNKGCRGAIVTHGTDTLHYTGAALSFMLKGLSKPVALVGAQRSPDRGSFDGSQNLICASHFVAKSNIGEVCIVMHGTTNDDYCLINRGTRCRKMHSSRRDAFRPINELPLGKVWPNGKIEITSKNYRKFENKKVKADVKFEPKTALVKIHPSSNPEIIDWYVSKKYRGIVIEGTGLGHVLTSTIRKQDSWLPHIKRAVNKGTVVVMTTQTIYGRTHPYVYRNLRLLGDAGAIFAGDIISEVAFVKLGWLLGHTRKTEKVKEQMLTNLVGELSERIEPKAFLV